MNQFLAASSISDLQNVRRTGNTTHGLSKTSEYSIWRSMLNRCHYPKYKEARYYSGRGITVCQRWRESFTAFLSDVGFRPSKRHSIDRIENDRGYEPGNVRWATLEEQARNRRNVPKYTVNGEAKSVAEWATIVGIPPQLITSRIRNGWPPEKAILQKPIPGAGKFAIGGRRFATDVPAGPGRWAEKHRNKNH